MLRTGSEMVPHQDMRTRRFVNNSSSMPKIGYLISIVFKYLGPNMSRPLLGSCDLLSAEFGPLHVILINTYHRKTAILLITQKTW